MLVLWIVLAVVAFALLSTAVIVGTRRRGGGPPVAEVPPTEQAAPVVEEAPPPPAPPPVAGAPPAEAHPTEAPPAEGTPAEAPTFQAEVVEAPQEVVLQPIEIPAEVEVAPRFRDRLGKARGIFAGLRAIRARGAVSESTWEELEDMLLRADVGVATTDQLVADLRRRVGARELTNGEEVVEALRGDLLALLAEQDNRELCFEPEEGSTNVWLFVGVNGVGKTTTVGKLARREQSAGRSVLLAAGDTFRAAAGEQLATWADRAGVEIVRGVEGGDPSAIVFDAVQRAAARGNDLVLADTAGRLHTKVNLVEELKKVRRVADRPPGKVTEVLLVLDATTGQNALTQARLFADAVAVTGVVLTKLDGTAKGGVVIAIQHQLGLPVKLVGLGEGPEDLVPFDPVEFVDALVTG